MKIEWRAWDKEFNCWAETDKVWMNQDGEVWRNGVDWTEWYHKVDETEVEEEE